MALSRTFQIDEDGYRVTAHFELLADNKWHLIDVTSNVQTVPVSAVKELMILIAAEDLSR